MERLDDFVPLMAFALTLAVQSILAVFWAARLEASVRAFEMRVAKLEANEERATQESKRAAEALVRLEERLMAQTQVLNEIRERLMK